MPTDGDGYETVVKLLEELAVMKTVKAPFTSFLYLDFESEALDLVKMDTMAKWMM